MYLRGYSCHPEVSPATVRRSRYSLLKPVLDSEVGDSREMTDVAGNDRKPANEGNGRDAKIGFRYRCAPALQFCPELSVDARCGRVKREDGHVRPDQMIQFVEKIVRASASIGTVHQLTDRDRRGELILRRNTGQSPHQGGRWPFREKITDGVRVKQVHYGSFLTLRSFACSLARYRSAMSASSWG